MPRAGLLAWLLCALAGAPMALAQDDRSGGAPGARRGPPPHHRGAGGPSHATPLPRMLEKYADRLGLDPPTIEEIRVIADASGERSRARRAELRALHAELRTLLGEESPDEQAVMLQAERIGAVETAAHQERLHDMLRVRALLTPEQRQELVRIHEERMQSRERRARDAAPAPATPP